MKPVTSNKLQLIYAAMIAVVIIVSLLYLNISIRKNLEESTCNTLEEIMQQQAHNFTSKLEGEKILVKNLADIIAPSGVLTDIPVSELAKIVDDTNFEYLGVADLSGKALLNTGQVLQVDTMPYYLRALDGEIFVSDPFMSRIRQEKVVVISAPIRYEEEIIGVLYGSYTAQKLNKLFLSSFEGKGYAFITNNEGVIIAHTQNNFTLTTTENLFEDWDKMSFYENDSFETLRKNLYENKSGHSRYQYKDQKRLVHYSTIGINDWNIFSIVPDAVISNSANRIILIVFSITILMILLFGVLIIWMLQMQKKHLKTLWDIAFLDDLTGAPTLAKFKRDSQQLIKENPDKRYVLIKNDVDRFKLINQTLGFEKGDQVLKNVAKAMKSAMCSEQEAYGRANIDEFVLLHEFKSEEHLLERRKIFLESFFERMGKDFTYNVTFPSGHYYLAKEDTDIGTAIEKANIAHQKAKQNGIEVCAYDESFIKEELDRKNIENKMEDALKNREFKMFLQPKRYLSDESIAGAEALVRWWINGRFIMHPAEFVPVFEKNGFVTKLDMYMFEEACSFLRGLMNDGKELLTISVNFSRLHLRNEAFVSTLCAIAEKYSVPKQYLEIELTETAIFDNEEVLRQVLDRLHAAEFTLSMDDFGTGYSSLGLLKNIAVDVIKIDRSFFVNAPNPKRAKTVLLNVIKMAKELGIHTVAEGVELKEHIDLLRELGCDIVQGYYYAKPMPFEEFLKQLSE